MNRKVLISFILLVLMIVVMRWQGSSLVTPATPRGILDFEFAKTSATFETLLAAVNKTYLKLNLYLDFLFIVVYTTFFVTIIEAIEQKLQWKTDTIFIIAALITGGLDIVENVCLLFALKNPVNPVLAVAYYAALIKFILVGVVVLYIIVSIPFLIGKSARQTGINA